MKGVEKTLGMHLNVLEGKKNHRLAHIQDQKLLLSLSSKQGRHSMRAHIQYDIYLSNSEYRGTINCQMKYLLSMRMYVISCRLNRLIDPSTAATATAAAMLAALCVEEEIAVEEFEEVRKFVASSPSSLITTSLSIDNSSNPLPPLPPSLPPSLPSFPSLLLFYFIILSHILTFPSFLSFR